MKPRKTEAAMLRPLVEALRQRRVAAGRKRTAVAEDVGYHHATLGRWERGETVPSTPALVWWCQSLGARLCLGEMTL